MLSKKLLEKLRDTIEEYLELNKGRYGLCEHLKGILSQENYYKLYRHELITWYSSWEKFSGCTVYPVPAPKIFGLRARSSVEDRAELIYDITPIGGYLEGEYGELRKEFCLHLISCIDKEFNKE